MNSFISNFRTESKVIAAVLLLLAAVEFSLYLGEPWLSADVRHIRQIPGIVENLRTAEPPRVLFLGNSLTRASIQPDLVADTLASANLPRVNPAMIFPDDTTIVDWHYLYRNFIQPKNPQLNLIVISFAYGHLDDHQPLNVERLGGEFAGLSSAPEAFAHDVLSPSDRIEYLLSCVFRLWADRVRVQTRVLALIPGYTTLAQVINRTLRGQSQHDLPDPPVTYHRLARFIGMVVEDGNKLVFVAVPVPRRYPLPQELRNTIRNAGAELIDLQGVIPFTPADFPDGYHLSAPAAQQFSKALARAMADNDYVRSALDQRATKPYK
ncbi:hypothetical protein NKJ46_27675 [Mesorhizobium sp. M0166]|uniref:hypothetical protein n=1 Tax=Mesorhizobium sp. M0166 TaxID=2956902 RepID=UPI003337F773